MGVKDFTCIISQRWYYICHENSEGRNTPAKHEGFPRPFMPRFDATRGRAPRAKWGKWLFKNIDFAKRSQLVEKDVYCN
jgi:hypothetical protein